MKARMKTERDGIAIERFRDLTRAHSCRGFRRVEFPRAEILICTDELFLDRSGSFAANSLSCTDQRTAVRYLYVTHVSSHQCLLYHSCGWTHVSWGGETGCVCVHYKGEDLALRGERKHDRRNVEAFEIVMVTRWTQHMRYMYAAVSDASIELLIWAWTWSVSPEDGGERHKKRAWSTCARTLLLPRPLPLPLHPAPHGARARNTAGKKEFQACNTFLAFLS
jgi:hypothetical protein